MRKISLFPEDRFLHMKVTFQKVAACSGIFIFKMQTSINGEVFMDYTKTVIDFLKLGITDKFSEGLKYFSPDCRTHNPYFAGNIETLTHAMDSANKEGKGKYPNAEFTIKQAIEEWETVAVHTELLNDKAKPGQGGLRQVHLFRFDGDKIVEYWDITQQITPEMPNASGAF